MKYSMMETIGQKKKKVVMDSVTDEASENKKEIIIDAKKKLGEHDYMNNAGQHDTDEQVIKKEDIINPSTDVKNIDLDNSLNGNRVEQEREGKDQENAQKNDTTEKIDTEVENKMSETTKEEDTAKVKDKENDTGKHMNNKSTTNSTKKVKQNRETENKVNAENDNTSDTCDEIKETLNMENKCSGSKTNVMEKSEQNDTAANKEKIEIPEEKEIEEGEKEEKKKENDEEKKKEKMESKKENNSEITKKEENTIQKESGEVKENERKESKKEDKNDLKKEETKGSQEEENFQKGNNNLSTSDATKGSYDIYGATNIDNKMYTMPMDNTYLNYPTSYLEQYYNSTANCYSDVSKASVYIAYNQHNANANNSNASVTSPANATTNMNYNMNDMKKGKKNGYHAKGSYETDYKMEDKNGNCAKMSSMYLNNSMNNVSNGTMPNSMVNTIGAGTLGNHMNYPGPAVAALPTAASVTSPVPTSVSGAHLNTLTSAVSVSNNAMDSYYMYNYSYMNNPNCGSYYYMYDTKGYEYQTKEVESEQPYDFSAVIDKSLEMMKRNNKVKEILKRPARLQITPEELNKYEYSEGSDSYNIWFGKYVTDRYDKSAKNIPRFVAKYKCNPQKDSGYTKADRVYNSKQYFCIYFARGCCAYGSNCLYKHRVPTENDELEFEHTIDIFGREKFSTYKDDMSGVGCFNSDCRTLFIGSVFINNFNDAPKVEKLLYDEFSNFGNVDYVRYIPNKNIAFVQYSNRVNAEFAKVAMSDQPLENHSTALTIKWAYEFKHPPTVYPHYYNTPYMYSHSQVISPTWGNYMMQQQYGGAATDNPMATHMNGHLPSYPNAVNAVTPYTDYTNMYSAQYKKNERSVQAYKQQFAPN